LEQKDDTTIKSLSTELPAFTPVWEKNSPAQQIARRGERPILAGATVLIADAFLFEFFLDLLPILIPSLILVLGVALVIVGIVYRRAAMTKFPQPSAGIE
jgi:hypothetical protein